MKEQLTFKEICNIVNFVAPKTEFISRYKASEPELGLILKQYKNKNFLYILAMDWEDNKKIVIYIGQSRDQYSRIQSHKMNFEYDELYLFSTPPSKQLEYEAALINEIGPLYNKSNNEYIKAEVDKLMISHDVPKSKDQILSDISLVFKSRKHELAIFYMPERFRLALYFAANAKQIDINEYLMTILEEKIDKKFFLKAIYEADRINDIPNEYCQAEQYAMVNGRSVEQIKVHCRNGRIDGTLKVGRDWILPLKATYPRDERFK